MLLKIRCSLILSMRMERDDRFLAGHCDNIEAVEFSFLLSPNEYYGMEMN